MITSELLALLKKLDSTQSSGVKLSYILEFLIAEGANFQDQNVKDLLNHYRNNVEKKKQQGSIGGIKTSNTKANVKHKSSFSKEKAIGTNHIKPMFVSDYKHNKPCKNCNKTITSMNAFRWRQPDGSYQDYHALPECFPEQHKHLFELNKNYQHTMIPMNDNRTIENGDEDYEQK